MNEIAVRPIRFPCGQCGAKLEYAPGTSVLKCAHCGYENAIAASVEQVQELEFHAYLAALERDADAVETTTIRCDACGAQTDKPPTVTALACPFCGSNIVTTQLSRRLIKPKSLLPFAVSRDEADRAFLTWLRRLWFAPSALRRLAAADQRLTGLYVPYWTYDCRTTTQYTGMRGDNYTETQHYTAVENGKTVTRTRTVTKTRWRPAAGEVYNSFNDLLVLAGTSLPRASIERLEPWDLAQLVPYRDEYLSGFRAESYTVNLAAGFDEAVRMMEGPIEASIRADIGGDHQQIHSKNTRYADLTFKHLLLPVWLSAYRFRDKVYRFLVNARTGEVQGERPWSAWKIVAFIAAIAAGAGGIALGLHYFGG